MKTYVGFVRDHSGSMDVVAAGAMKDYNLVLNGLQKEVTAIHDVYGSVIGCGMNWRGSVELIESLKPIKHLSLLKNYETPGGSTPLWESVMTAIDSVCNYKSNYSGVIENEAYLIIVTTDGGNNSGKVSFEQLRRRIADLQRTDQWTFVFRVPKGDKSFIVDLGIPEGNVVEWEQTAKGVEKVSAITQSAIPQYFEARTRGLTSSQNFYTTNLSNVSLSEVKQDLTDISKEVWVERVWSSYNGCQIRPFCEEHFGEYKLGSAFYELMKKENLQPYKKIIIKHLKSGKYYGGPEARAVLGLLDDKDIKVKPGDHGQYQIYVQSTSVNRKLIGNTNLVYWKNV